MGNPGFKGPTTITGRKRESKVLVSDYFGRNNWRTLNAAFATTTGTPIVFPPVYGSCEPFKHAAPPDPKDFDSRAISHYSSSKASADMWSTPLQAGLIDGSVIDYKPAEADVLQVLSNPQDPLSSDVLSDGLYGDFYIPR